MDNRIINQFFNEFPDETRDILIERSKKEIWLLIANKTEIEKELEEEKAKVELRLNGERKKAAAQNESYREAYVQPQTNYSRSRYLKVDASNIF